MMVWGKTSVSWIIVRLGPTALAVFAGGGSLDFFFYRLLFLSSSFSLGDDLI